MQLRPATIDDAEMLFTWRNDTLTREASINTDPVAWDSHVNWLRASLQSDKRKLLIAEAEGEPVGTVRFDYGDEAEMSWTVSPTARGKGLGKHMVRAAIPNGPVIAHIKRENAASQRIAQFAGFSLVEDEPLQRWERSHSGTGMV